jgi:pimeloyl-ACP methyl ester carboxylesterase
MLALGHPRLFSTLVLIDPVIAADAIKGMGPGLTSMTLRRQREWSSRQAAEKAFSKAFKSWDPRVLKKFNQFGLYPYHDPKTKDKEISTRLATGRPQELSGVVRPAFIYNGNLEPENMPWVEEALTVDDLVGFIPCSTVYVCGSLSPATNPEIRKDWLARTGTGKHMGKPFGRRRVQAKVIDGVGHFVPMEKPTACAEAVVGWIDEEVGEWEEEEKKLNRWRDMTAEKKEEAMKIWMNNLKAKF